MGDNEVDPDSVTATVELSGEYEQIAEILTVDGEEYSELRSIEEDIGAVMDIVTRTGGATRSRVAEELPPDVAGGLDADSVIHVLRTLEIYGLVRLDGNTWRPGPALSPD